MDIPWPQLIGAMTGGLIGGFAGFLTNSIQQGMQSRLIRSNVACALRGEIIALSTRIGNEYLELLKNELQVLTEHRRYPSHRFSGQRDYAQVYRSLGQQIGFLPNDLVCELVSWYISLTVYQDRAHELHDLTKRKDPELLDYAIEVAKLQHTNFSDLVLQSGPLIEGLSAFQPATGSSAARLRYVSRRAKDSQRRKEDHMS